MLKTIIDNLKYRKNPIQFCRNKGVKIGVDCQIMGGYPFGSEPYLIEIGDHVRINTGVRFITHDGSVWVIRYLAGNSSWVKEEDIDLDKFGKITVGNNVQFGTNAFVMPGVTIGNNVIIGAGAIVTKNVPDNSVMAGVPARQIETVQEFYKKNKEQFTHTKNMSYEEKKQYLIKKFMGESAGKCGI